MQNKVGFSHELHEFTLKIDINRSFITLIFKISAKFVNFTNLYLKHERSELTK